MISAWLKKLRTVTRRARARFFFSWLYSFGRKWAKRCVLVTILLVACWWCSVWSVEFPDVYLGKHTASALILEDSQGLLLRQEATSAGLREHWVSLDKISAHLINATIASEDNAFRDHSGVDWIALGRASWLNVKGAEVAYGGSTLTMQLARTLRRTPRSVWGKIKQSVFAARLERKLSKNEILEQYLNRAYYGNGAWGVEQASKLYFDKTAAELSLGEASLLVVFPRGPTFYKPFKYYSRALKRRTHILGLMEEHGFIAAAEKNLATRIPIGIGRKRNEFRAPHFAELVKSRLPSQFRTASTVQTTLDYELQSKVEIALIKHVDSLVGKNMTQAAAVVLRNSDGALLAMVGSRDYFDVERNGAFNGATAILRPGSTLKPFVYADAMEKGDTPATMAFDLALPEDAHLFYTKDVKSHGFARYRESLAGSYNLSAVHTLQRVGISAVLAKLRKAGLWTLNKEDSEYDWGLAIGHAEVRLLDLSAAFSTFGRGGIPLKVKVVERATSVSGEVYVEKTGHAERVFSEEVSYQIFDILSDADARKPMFGDRVPMNLPFPVALKTGTTKAYTDLWAIGTTAEYTVGVWGGNFDGAPTHRVMSLQGATPLMRSIYTIIANQYGDPTAPSRPEMIVDAKICPLSGKRPGPHCSHQKNELFIRDNVPSEVCDWHRKECGIDYIAYPSVLRSWTQFYGLYKDSPCNSQTVELATLRIISPVSDAHFLLEDHRSPLLQRPFLAATHSASGLSWTIDGVSAADWIPSRGTHTVKVTKDNTSDQISITYE